VETAIADVKDDHGERADVPARYRGPKKSAMLSCVRTGGYRAPRNRRRAYAADSHSSATAGDNARAERTGRRAVELSERAVALDPVSRALRDDLGRATATLGQIFQRTFRLREAADLYRRAIDIREALVKEEPDNTNYRTI
jgi:tetratricopeptide (TPR) repeat protein